LDAAPKAAADFASGQDNRFRIGGKQERLQSAAQEATRLRFAGNCRGWRNCGKGTAGGYFPFWIVTQRHFPRLDSAEKT